MNSDEINKIVSDYFKDNKKEIVVYINKQVETQVKKKIREIFNNDYFYDEEDHLGTKMVNDKVIELVEPIVDNITVDEEEIKRKVKAKVNRKLKNLNININI